MSVFSAITVLKENGTQSHSAKFLNWGDHVNSVPDLAAALPGKSILAIIDKVKIQSCGHSRKQYVVLCFKHSIFINLNLVQISLRN